MISEELELNQPTEGLKGLKMGITSDSNKDKHGDKADS